MRRPLTEEDFWTRVDKSRGADACWLWTGCRSSGSRPFENRYGSVVWKDRTRGAHCVAWEIANARDVGGLYVLHSCDNPPCCNPAHLSLGTQLQNRREAVARGRTARRAKPEVVSTVIALRQGGATLIEIAAQVHVARATVQRILKAQKERNDHFRSRNIRLVRVTRPTRLTPTEAAREGR